MGKLGWISGAGKALLLGVFSLMFLLSGGAGISMAEEGAALAPVSVPHISVSGTVVRAAELTEAYYVSLERADVPEGVQNKVVLSMSPESEITIGGVKRTPDEFLRLVDLKKDQATAVYYVNSEGMKHVVSIDIPK